MTTLRDTLQSVAALPEDRPMGLTGGFYTAAEQFAHESATVLRRGWHCVGRVDEIPDTGDYFTIQLLNEPLLVVRGQSGIHALANVCQHRGMPLAEGSGNAKRFVCSYHAWTYGLDGALMRAPRMKNAGFDPKSCRLPEHLVQLWNGFIYVNLTGDAAPFHHPELDALLAPYETERFRLVHVAEEDWACNWKSLVENFMEGYHLSVVHPQTLHSYTPTGLSRKLGGGGGYTSYAANYPNGTARGQGAPGLSAAERQRSTLFANFPTHVASQAATLLASLCIFPVDSGRIRVKWTLSTYGDDLDEHTIRQRIGLWEQVNAEDREKLERQHIGLGSVHAKPGPLAGPDMEGTIRDFHLWLAEQDRAAP
ncbi:Rieske 2Fe-2S domain protein [Candidatus Rhodobacter oscarellae]|uniref:Rieske 2Fe-2S domain protein n=1 Tax=Candidatus Rhodobacter oscarellae TaxID=1675527 RepID=A0A0J9GZ99_9RHOB|nr:aromatic ring-hydroxylating dioxygenase subunit alpha [Candidatus Rhodobacter lobularis]KMW58798.1 Rieske 2Fe-2S domain protein [Candidatus Rhodobacter lobularis]